MTQRHISGGEERPCPANSTRERNTLLAFARSNPSINASASFGRALRYRKVRRFVGPQLPARDPQILPICPVGRDSCEIAIGNSVHNQEELSPHMGDTHLGHGTDDRMGEAQGYTSCSPLAGPIAEALRVGRSP